MLLQNNGALLPPISAISSGNGVAVLGELARSVRFIRARAAQR